MANDKNNPPSLAPPADVDTTMAEPEDELASSASGSATNTNLGQSIASLRDVEMSEDGNKVGTSKQPVAQDDDDLYLHPSSSSKNEHREPNDNEDGEHDDDEDDDDDDEVMARTLRPVIQHGDGSDVDDEEDDDEENGDFPNGGEAAEEDDNPFRAAQSLLQHFQDPFGSMAQMLHGMPNRLAPCIDAITQRDDPSTVMTGLHEIAEIILMTPEETLNKFLPTAKLLDALADVMVDPLFEDDVEISLIACRCLCNLLDANSSTLRRHSYTRIVQVLCQKLFEIQYIDIAEQALTVCLFHFTLLLLLLTVARPLEKFLPSRPTPLSRLAACQQHFHTLTFSQCQLNA